MSGAAISIAVPSREPAKDRDPERDLADDDREKHLEASIRVSTGVLNSMAPVQRGVDQ
jgi:hypothetical protein